MPRVDVVVETPIGGSPRARQLEGLFDVPRRDRQRLEWHADLPIDDDDWNVGLIVGPSGSGKTQVARAVFGAHMDAPLSWGGASVVDDFASHLSTGDIAAVCQAVGFNTIPAWLRPYAVLSNGEKFRVDLARRLVELADPIVVDEFSSVVDRQVAQIGAHAVQKFVRRNRRKFVAVSCHFDIVDWLQPDWLFAPGEGTFRRRSLQSRPQLSVAIGRVPHATWAVFAPYHYLSNSLHRSASCYALWCEGSLAAFAGALFRPSTGKQKNIWGISRLVTLPDWQGVGLAFVLSDTLGAAYKAIGRRLRMYPAHPALVRAFDRSVMWALRKKPDYTRCGRIGATAKIHRSKTPGSAYVGRPCAVFEYVGPASADVATARRLLDGER